MAITKEIFYDIVETLKIKNHYVLQLRKRISIKEDNKEISFSYEREVLNPDADVSTITDPVVLAQFNAIMTDEVKTNYQTFLASQSE